MQPRIPEQIPRYGWAVVQTQEFELDNMMGSLVSQVFDRPAGLSRVTVYASVNVFDLGGTGTFGFVLEGSNTGDTTNDNEWNYIAGITGPDAFSSPPPGPLIQQRMLGAVVPDAIPTFEPMRGEGLVSIGRYRFLRVRAFVISEDGGDPVSFLIRLRLKGIAADGQRMLRARTLVKVGGSAIPSDDVVATSTIVRRPAGTRYMTVQALVQALKVSPVGSDGFFVRIEGAISESEVAADNWILVSKVSEDKRFLDDVPPGPAQAYFFSQGQNDLIEMGPFNFFRATLVRFDSGAMPSDDFSSAIVSVVFVFDNSDWIDGDVGITFVAESLLETYVVATWYGVEESAGTITVRLQLLDMNDNPLNAQRVIGVAVTDEIWADPVNFPGSQSATATFDTIADVVPTPAGALPAAKLAPAAALPQNVMVVRTDTSGQVEFTLTSGASPDTVYVQAFNVIPDPALLTGEEAHFPGQLLLAAARETLFFP